MDSKIAIIAGVVVVALVAAGAGGFLLLNGNDDKETTVTEMAQGFTYDGAFGAFKFSDKSTEELGSVIMPIEGSGMLSHSQIDWKKSDDAKADYDAIVAKIKEKGTFAGTSPVVLSVDNENMYVVEYNMNMPTSKFTLVYFAAYNGKTVIECYSNPLYHPSGLASDADISEILSTVMKTVGAEAVTVTTPADALATLGTKAYKGVYGTLTVKEGATADTASMFKTNASDRLATSAITFKNTADAKAKYEAAAAEILAKPAMMGAQPMALSITGADYTAVQFNVKMGMSTFSLVYIAGYSGNVFIDGYSEAMYLTSFATVNDVAELINTAQFVLGGDNVNVALAPATSASGFITAYSGALEGFAAADSNNATAAKV
ncbi:MAG: hypothetical protein MJZ21_05915, partial [archaeon]|nr:hypothetical protein [archaeon]